MGNFWYDVVERHANSSTASVVRATLSQCLTSGSGRSTGLWRACTAMQIILPGGWVSQPFLWRRQIRSRQSHYVYSELRARLFVHASTAGLAGSMPIVL